MEFDDTHKVKIETLTKEEKKEFEYWLTDELWRHQKCIAEAKDQMTKRQYIIPILESAVIRHVQDIEGIVGLLKRLREGI